MSRFGKIARRSFLVLTGVVGAGVAFGAWRYLRDPGNPLAEGLPEGAASPNAYVMIDREGVTVITPRADVGQGAASMQAFLVAEELDIDPQSLTLSPGPASPVYWNGAVAGEGMPFAAWQESTLGEFARGRGSDILGKLVGLHITGGSSTVPDLFERLRVAGATAREVLKLAAAQRTGLPVEDLRTENGRVLTPDGTEIPYTDLATEAAGIAPPEKVALRQPNEWRWLCRPMMRTDMAAKSTGTFDYGTDIRMDGMLHATVLSNPGRGGGVARMDDSAARALPGVEDVLPVTDGFAVIGRTDWHAMRGARAVDVTWGDSPYSPDLASHWANHEATLGDPDRQDSQFRNDGDAGAMDAGPEVEYRAPLLAHAPLEPSNATVIYTPERTQVWTSTQVPIFARNAVARITGQGDAAIDIHVVPGGGSFGRRLEDDYILPAIEVAMARPGEPVRLTWSREQDMQCDYYRPLGLARGRFAHANGKVTGLDLSIAAQSVTESQMGRVGLPVGGPDIAITACAWDAPYMVPDFRVTGYRVPIDLGVSSWRSVGASMNGFFIESLMDEAIHAAGADPLEERLRLLEHGPSRAVLETVGEMCNWSGPEGKRGLAFCFSFGVPVAQVIEVEETDQGLRMAKLWIAADVGHVLDPVNLESQLSGGALYGLGHAMAAEITLTDGRPDQTNFHDYPSLRLYQTPEVNVRALGRGGDIRGAGEPGTPPAAPALANAIFALTGTRLREMPFSKTVRFA